MPHPATSDPVTVELRRLNGGGDAEQEHGAAHSQPLTKQEADALRSKQGEHSPWRVLVMQCSVGLLLAALLGAFGGMVWLVSALYGVAVVVVPGAMMARALKRSMGLPPGTVLMRFAVWELAKLLLAVAMMVVAPKLIGGLSWVALLSTLIVCLKMNWAVWLFDQSRAVQRSIFK